jgi:hypothetical protein
MSAHFCDGCGDGHDWRDCPEVEESIFEHDPEWDAEEPPPTSSCEVWGFSTADPEWRPAPVARAEALEFLGLMAALERYQRAREEPLRLRVEQKIREMAPAWGEVLRMVAEEGRGPRVDPPEPRVGQGLSHEETEVVLWTENGKWTISGDL